MARINTILVANRGEIAVRVMRTAKTLGYRTVAVYSEADASAPHVKMADASALIGPPPVGESYLKIENILDAARDTGADALHPGYGFLSENAGFARACEDAGLTFIGPPEDAIALMGNKAAAKRRMIDAGVPCVPGYEGVAQDDNTLIAAAEDIGYPLMVKAAAGGGGRGMRLVAEAEELPQALSRARSEAERAFGSGELILEKAIVDPRHVEVQVFADAHGGVIHLGERDCSVQRRHQKVIEEAPCPVMTEDLRAEMGAAAVEAARSIGYRGAGTVEFLLDAEGDFYFLEMNTRLQVEHPVTEMITGLDLVALQIAVAEGRPLGLTQEDVRLDGHAIEVRLYAEDPVKDFLPSAGTIDLWAPPIGDGVRTDAGIESGQEVSPFYDPMLAKIIAHGPDREAARRTLIRALENTVLFGPANNRAFLIDALSRQKFAEGEATTAFIGEEYPEGVPAPAPPSLSEAATAAALQYAHARDALFGEALAVSPELLNWSNRGAVVTRIAYRFGDTDVDLTVTPAGVNRYVISQGEKETVLALRQRGDGRAEVDIDGQSRHVRWHARSDSEMDLSFGASSWRFVNGLATAAAGLGRVRQRPGNGAHAGQVAGNCRRHGSACLER